MRLGRSPRCRLRLAFIVLFATAAFLSCGKGLSTYPGSQSIDARADGDRADAGSDAPVGPDSDAPIDRFDAMDSSAIIDASADAADSSADAADAAADGSRDTAMRDAGTDVQPRVPMTDHGGKVLVHPDIVLSFWGSYWNSPPVTAGQIAGAFQTMSNGPYFSVLNQYGGVAYPTLSWMAVDALADVPDPNTFSASDVISYINSRLADGTLPSVSAVGGEQIYVVVLPPGYAQGDILGAHGRAAFNDQAYYYAWIGNSGNLSASDSTTRLLGQEISDTMTNPDGDGWCKDDGGHCTGATLQNPVDVGDVCQWTLIDGVAYAQLWSEANQTCVVPRYYGSLWQYDGSPNTWTQIWGNVGQATCGPWGLVATDPDGSLFSYNGSPNDWTQIDGGGAAVVVGQDSVYRQTSDLGGINRYDGTGTSWTQIGVNAVNIYAGGFGVFGTDMGANDLYRWDGSGTSWTFYGNSGASFVVGSNFIAGVTPDHATVWETNDGNWNEIRAIGTAQLFAGGGSPFLVATDTGTGDVSVYSSGTWLPQGGPGYVFGLSDDTLYGLKPTRWGIFNSTSLTTGDPPWTQDGYAASGLVPGCPSLYATNGIVECDEGLDGTEAGICGRTIQQ